MRVKEYRVCLPMKVEEFQVAQLYMVAKASEQNTGEGEGVEVLKNEPYENETGKGQYTHKIYHIASRIPGWIRAVIPKDATKLEEEAWNAYPHCKTVLTSGYLSKEKFQIVVETMHLPDRGDTENAVNLAPELLKDREVVHINITDDIPKDQYVEAEDPLKYKSEKTGRGPLDKEFSKTHDPVMCCYKVVTANFSYWGFQGKVENAIVNMQHNLFHTTLRQAHALTDEWFGLTMEDIRSMEAETAERLAKNRIEGKIERKLQAHE